MKNKNFMKENDRRISKQMQEGFDITSDSYSIRKLETYVNNGKIHDAPYQRGSVWDDTKKKELIESIIKYGGKKVPPITLRNLSDGTMEIVDGKQRLLSSIMSFLRNEFALNGVSTPEFTGYKLSDIEENYPFTYSSFMATEIPIVKLTDMSDEDAITYFYQINSSGVKMNCGEKIHALQNTYILEAIESLKKHNVWNNVTHISRYQDYEYIAMMLLFVRDTNIKQKIFAGDERKKILRKIEAYRQTEVPKYMIDSVKETLNFLEKIFKKYNFKLPVRKFYNVFVYANIYKDSLSVSDFGKFIKELHYFLMDADESSGINMFRIIKSKHTEKGFVYNSNYYKWYINTLNKMYGKYVGGCDWDDIKQL